MHHQQIRVAVHQCDRAVAPEIHIGLVDDDDAVRIAGHDARHILKRHETAGRRIRIREDDAAGGRVSPGKIVFRNDPVVLVERTRLEPDAIQAAVSRIEAVGDVRKPQRTVLFQQAQEGVGQHFVRSVADEDLIRFDLEARRERPLEAIRIRVGVEPQHIRGLGANRVQRAGRRAERMFVGVELDQPVQFGLFARHIRCQPAYEGAPVSAHRVGSL